MDCSKVFFWGGGHCSNTCPWRSKSSDTNIGWGKGGGSCSFYAEGVGVLCQDFYLSCGTGRGLQQVVLIVVFETKFPIFWGGGGAQMKVQSCTLAMHFEHSLFLFEKREGEGKF